jgi:hypothetical protein
MNIIQAAIFMTVFVFFATAKALAANDSIPVHLKNLSLPDFKLQLVNSKDFFTENLDKGKATILIHFSPDCDHCQQLAMGIIANIKSFSKTQIIMSTTLPAERLRWFYETFELKKYQSTITVGRDVLFFFPNYFKNHYLPGIAVYNKKRALLNFYDGGVKPEELIALVK